jgi:hypothetical protein
MAIVSSRSAEGSCRLLGRPDASTPSPSGRLAHWLAGVDAPGASTDPISSPPRAESDASRSHAQSRARDPAPRSSCSLSPCPRGYRERLEKADISIWVIHPSRPIRMIMSNRRLTWRMSLRRAAIYPPPRGCAKARRESGGSRETWRRRASPPKSRPRGRPRARLPTARTPMLHATGEGTTFSMKRIAPPKNPVDTVSTRL